MLVYQRVGFDRFRPVLCTSVIYIHVSFCSIYLLNLLVVTPPFVNKWKKYEKMTSLHLLRSGTHDGDMNGASKIASAHQMICTENQSLE